MLRQRPAKKIITTGPSPTHPQPQSDGSKTDITLEPEHDTSTNAPPLHRSSRGQSTAMDGQDDPRDLDRNQESTCAIVREDDESLSQRQRPSSSSSHSRLLGVSGEQEMENLSKKSQWIVLALASGGCAAFNGVFAKLYVVLPFLYFLLPLPCREISNLDFRPSACELFSLFLLNLSRPTESSYTIVC